MAVSVRMDPLMEKELELAAKRQGITKSQFIIEAVERALGHKDPAALYRKVMEESARYRVGEEVPDDALSPIKAALRQRLPELVRELHLMGGSFAPVTEAREFVQNPRREFNLRFDPEAARTVLRSPWRRLTCAPIDISQNVRAAPDLFARIARSGTPLAGYLDRFGRRDRPMWDEVAAATWIEPGLVTRTEHLHVDVETARGPAWGETIDLPAGSPHAHGTLAAVQLTLDIPRFQELFVSLCSRP